MNQIKKACAPSTRSNQQQICFTAIYKSRTREQNSNKPLQSYIRKECISSDICQTLCDKIQDFAEDCLVNSNFYQFEQLFQSTEIEKLIMLCTYGKMFSIYIFQDFFNILTFLTKYMKKRLIFKTRYLVICS